MAFGRSVRERSLWQLCENEWLSRRLGVEIISDLMNQSTEAVGARQGWPWDQAW